MEYRTPDAADAASSFDVETRVARAFFRVLGDNAPGDDPEALYQAGRTLSEAADRLLAVLLAGDD